MAKPPASWGLRSLKRLGISFLACAGCARKKAARVIGMKINIDELTYEEIKDVVDRLRAMKIESKFSRLGSSIVLQTEQGPMVIARNEAVELFGIPAVF